MSRCGTRPTTPMADRAPRLERRSRRARSTTSAGIGERRRRRARRRRAGCVVKGEPEGSAGAQRAGADADAAATLCRALRRRRAGHRGRRANAPGASRAPTDADEHDLDFVGFLVFVDRPKADAAASLGTPRPRSASS